ncbi:putative signal peptide protein [Pandoraea horticolens]|uniref:Putative signal peptide protein n=1 Tax=Pandoraea horticolens TaxID=2508298 RepID=A0A5E4Z6M0_9BURK|nr:YXWGXW repeat-containing protein [Pandoraea horticolens]VVE56941.1 putative signal peptide protein [Pandoraea horticolens]
MTSPNFPASRSACRPHRPYRPYRRYALAVALCLASLPVLADVTLQRGPPPPRFEDPHAAPKGEFWVPGYWQWKDGRYDWVDGHTEPKRPGMRYTPPHWEETGDHEWTLRDGAWEPSGWGPGTIHEIRAPQ